MERNKFSLVKKKQMLMTFMKYYKFSKTAFLKKEILQMNNFSLLVPIIHYTVTSRTFS